MNEIISFFYLLITLTSAANFFIFINLYKKTYDKIHIYYSLIILSLFIIELVTIVNYILYYQLKLFVNSDLYIKIINSYLIISVILTAYFFIRYFIFTFDIKVNTSFRIIYSIIMFSPAIAACFLISINYDSDKIILLRNFSYIIFSIITFLFAIASLIKIKLIALDNLKYAILLIISGLLFSAAGIIDGYYEYFYWDLKFLYPAFNLLMIAINFFFSPINNYRHLENYQDFKRQVN
jgi:hypothetical protein